jgi:hypothetical protein
VVASIRREIGDGADLGDCLQANQERWLTPEHIVAAATRERARVDPGEQVRVRSANQGGVASIEFVSAVLRARDQSARLPAPLKYKTYLRDDINLGRNGCELARVNTDQRW